MVISKKEALTQIKAEGLFTLEDRAKALEERIDAAIKANRNPRTTFTVVQLGSVPADDLVGEIGRRYRVVGWNVRWCLDYNPPQVHVYI